MSESFPIQESRARRYGVPAVFAVATLLLHLAFNPYFGYHQDEFYFIACGQHLSFGYVDHAPLVPWIARLSQALFGESIAGLRFFPALAGSAAVFLAGLLANRLGGGRFAQALTCLMMLIAPVYLRSTNVLCIPAFEPIYWLLASYFVVRIIQEDNPRLWLAVGAIAGLGLMNKHSMLFFGFGLAVAIIATPLRKYLKTPWPYAGGAIAMLIFAPNILWQMQNGWPTLEFLRELNKEVMSDISTPEFLIGQILYEHPFNAPIWIAGLVSLLFGRAKQYRALGIIYVSVLVVMLITKGKIYYLAPAYPALFAAGAVAVERFSQRPMGVWFRPAVIALLAVGGALFMPLSLPMLDIERTDRYIKAVTMGLIKNAFELTGDLHAQFGWPELVDETARVYNTLTPEEKEKCLIVGRGYGIAGAIDYYGKNKGLPAAAATHMTYYLWGYPEKEYEVFLLVGYHEKYLRDAFSDVRLASTFTHPHVNPWMNGLHITICRNPKVPLPDLWKRMKSYG